MKMKAQHIKICGVKLKQCLENCKYFILIIHILEKVKGFKSVTLTFT